MLNRKNNGFSLVELMVVVAIIGILAAIGFPQYSKFRAKARQSEAKGALSSLFVLEMSFMKEWNKFSVNLHNIGFGLNGTRLRYVTGFYVAGPPGIGCPGYGTTMTATGGAPLEDPTGAFATNADWLPYSFSCGSEINPSATTNAVFAGPTDWNFVVAGIVTQCTAVATQPAGTVSSCNSTPGAQNFTAVSVGDPHSDVGNVNLDGWTINQAKNIKNSTFGL